MNKKEVIIEEKFKYIKELSDDQIETFITNKVSELSKDFSQVYVSCLSSKLIKDNLYEESFGNDIVEFIPQNVPVYPSNITNPVIFDNMDIYIKFIKSLQFMDNVSEKSVISCACDYLDHIFGYYNNINYRNLCLYNEEFANGVSISYYLGKNAAACLERSVIFHNLLTIVGIKDHLILSNISYITSNKDGNHAYNIVESEKGDMILIDTVHPYVVKVGDNIVRYPLYKKIGTVDEFSSMEQINVEHEKDFYITFSPKFTDNVELIQENCEKLVYHLPKGYEKNAYKVLKNSDIF